MKKQVKKQMKKQYMPAVIVCVLILLLAAAGVGIHVVKKYIPTKERMNLNEYYMIRLIFRWSLYQAI